MKLIDTDNHFGFLSRKMPPGGSPSQPGKIVEITYHEENSKLRLSDGPEVSSAHSPILIREKFILFTFLDLSEFPKVLPQKVWTPIDFLSIDYIIY